MDRAEVKHELQKYQLTDFATDVLLATLRIKRGTVVTYKQLAKMSGHPNAYRAVGSVLRKNPLPIKIPCHRIVRSDGKTGSYAGVKASRKKVKLLTAEGAFKKGKLKIADAET